MVNNNLLNFVIIFLACFTLVSTGILVSRNPTIWGYSWDIKSICYLIIGVSLICYKEKIIQRFQITQ